jgi:hypothetical protein
MCLTINKLFVLQDLYILQFAQTKKKYQLSNILYCFCFDNVMEKEFNIK